MEMHVLRVNHRYGEGNVVIEGNQMVGSGDKVVDKTVNKNRSQSIRSCKEMVCSRGVGVSFGSTLPRSVRATSMEVKNI